MVCPLCGAESLEQARFCQGCGAELSQGSVAVTESATPVPTKAAAEPSESDDSLSHPEPPTALPIPENIAAVVSYITPIPAVLLLYLKPFRDSLFLRFHAFQHILLFLAAIAFLIFAAILGWVIQFIPTMRVLVFPFMGLAALAWFFVWLLLVIKAYYHEAFKLPILGDLADEWSRK